MTPAGDIDEGVLDDVDALERLDPGDMLRAVASAGSQVREGLLVAEQAGPLLTQLAEEGRPRAVVITGMGGSGIVGDVAAAVAGRSCPLPVVANRSPRLPGWVGSMDLVLAVSASGTTQETLSAAEEAVHRGARVVTVGAAGSTLAELAGAGRALHLPVETHGRMPRACLWALAVPVLTALTAADVVATRPEVLAVLADELDTLAESCGPAVLSVDNPAKRLALELAGTLPYFWGASDLATVAATRALCQLAENAKHPAVSGPLTEVHHNQVVVLAGPYGELAADDAGDLFRDRVDEGPGRPRVRIVVLRDTEELPEVAARADATHRLAERYGVATSELRAAGEHPVRRLGGLVGVIDYASVYLALGLGIDPTPITPIAVLKTEGGQG
jgi:glucose/mannose-6-phosphate isomerase